MEQSNYCRHLHVPGVQGRRARRPQRRMGKQHQQQLQEKHGQPQGLRELLTQRRMLQAPATHLRSPTSAVRRASPARVIAIFGFAACLRPLCIGGATAAAATAATPAGTTAVVAVHSHEGSVLQDEKGPDNVSRRLKLRGVPGRRLMILASHDVPVGPPDDAESSSAAPSLREAAGVPASEWLAVIGEIGGTDTAVDSTSSRNRDGGDKWGDAILASPQAVADPEKKSGSASAKLEIPLEGPKPATGRRRQDSTSNKGQGGFDEGVASEALRFDGRVKSREGRGEGDNNPEAAAAEVTQNIVALGKQQLPPPTEQARGWLSTGQRERPRKQDGVARGGERVDGKRVDDLDGERTEEGDAGAAELQAGAPDDGVGMIEVDVKNETESLVAVKVGLNSLRTIETEVEKHVEELLGLFSGERQGGGQKYKAAALGVQHEVEDIRQELVKLLKTINSTNDGILGAENEIQKKDAELDQLHAIEEVEGAKGKLNDGNMKVDYETGKIRWGDAGGANKAVKNGVSHETARKKVESMKEEWDPALLHLNPTLLGDFVILCMSAALGGIMAAWFGLPETLGYIAGGMAVGRSGANLIRMVKEVHTFSQFGSIFLLFGHGLLYSTLFHAASAANSTVYAQQGRMGAFTVLFVVFSALLVCAAMIGIDEVRESVFLAAAATLSSTAMVTEFVAHRRLGDTIFARMVVDLVAVQDFIMCPLLAIPTAIISFQESEGTGGLFPRVAGCAILLTGVFLASRRLLPLAMKRLVLSDNEKEQSSSLFTLGVVSYCVGLALVCERLNLSHEAGALFAGLLMADSPFAKRAHACMQPLTSLFGGMYLGSLGMIVSPAYMVWHLGDVLGCVLLLVLIKFMVVATVMKSFGFSWEASTLAGACMAQVSEISLFFSARAVHLKLIGRDHYLIAVATTIILMVASPMVITALQTFHRGGVGSAGGGGGGGGAGDCLPSALKGVVAGNGSCDGGSVSGGMAGDGARLGAVELGPWRSPRNRKKEEDGNVSGSMGLGRGKESTAMTATPSVLVTAAVEEEEGGAVGGGGKRRGGWLSRSSGGGGGTTGGRTTGTRRRLLLV